MTVEALDWEVYSLPHELLLNRLTSFLFVLMLCYLRTTAMEDVRSFSSKIVDLRSIPQESASRIASLLRARRERAVADAAAAVSGEQVITSMGVDEVDAEEKFGREGILKQEQKGMDWIRRQLQDALQGSEASFLAYQELTKLEARRDKQARKLEQEMLRQSFWNFQDREGLQKPSRNAQGGKNSSATIDDATQVLCSLFERSMMPFATDNEECWRRGITNHPSQQKPTVVESPDRRRTTIAPYHEFAQSLRENYRSKQPEDWWRTSPSKSPSKHSTCYRSTPMSTFVHNYPYHAPPQ